MNCILQPSSINLFKDCPDSLDQTEMFDMRKQGQFRDPGEKTSRKARDRGWVVILGQVIKGQILVNKVMKGSEIIHVSECKATRTRPCHINMMFSH